MFPCGPRNNYMRGPSQHSTPLRLLTPSALFASVLPRKYWVGGAKADLSPGTGNPRYATGRTRS